MINQENSYELFKFEDGDFSLDVKVDFNNRTVWLSQNDMSNLFNKSRSTITQIINDLYDVNTLKTKTSVETSVGNTSIRNHRPPKLYNLEVITAVGHRIKSNRIIKFKEWCNSLFDNYVYDNDNKYLPISSEKMYEIVEFIDGDLA